MIPFSKPTVGGEEIEALARVVQSGWLVPGPETEAFEQEFSDYISPEGEHYYCIFTNSCTSALKMAYKWLQTQGIKEIYYPENTFCATYSAAIEIGLNAYPFTEDDSIIPASVQMWYGGVKNGLPCLIEDSAHRIEPNDSLVGKIRCYSFHATKNMTTNGAGGMFVTNDKTIYERARLYWRDGLNNSTADRLSGAATYEVLAMAGGYDATDGAAAFGRVQLKRLPDFTKRRNDIRDRYNDAFGTQWLGNHLYCYMLNSAEAVQPFIKSLRDLGVQASYHYPNTGWCGVSLPIYPLLTNEQVEQVISAVNETNKALRKG